MTSGFAMPASVDLVCGRRSMLAIRSVKTLFTTPTMISGRMAMPGWASSSSATGSGSLHVPLAVAFACRRGLRGGAIRDRSCRRRG